MGKANCWVKGGRCEITLVESIRRLNIDRSCPYAHVLCVFDYRAATLKAKAKLPYSFLNQGSLVREVDGTEDNHQVIVMYDSEGMNSKYTILFFHDNCIYVSNDLEDLIIFPEDRRG